MHIPSYFMKERESIRMCDILITKQVNMREGEKG
jgi:hypothetical protein